MIDHVNLPVADLQRSVAFYQPVLAVLGARMLHRDGNAVGFGKAHWSFGLALAAAPVTRLHLAFNAADHETVIRFHRAALSAGGTDNGAPGLRVQYHPRYFAAFVLDPDGHNLESVCRV